MGIPERETREAEVTCRACGNDLRDGGREGLCEKCATELQYHMARLTESDAEWEEAHVSDRMG